LEATRSALDGAPAIDDLIARLPLLLGGVNGAAAELREAFAARERSLFALQDVIRRKNVELDRAGADLARREREFQDLSATLSRIWEGSHPLLARARRGLTNRPRLKRVLKSLFGGGY